MLRMREYYCDRCGARWEQLIRVEDKKTVRHCKRVAKELAMAPAVKYLQAHFNRGLGEYVNDARDLDKKLAAKGSFIPSKLDVIRAIENPGGDPAPDRMPDPTIRAAAQKAWSRLHCEGKA